MRNDVRTRTEKTRALTSENADKKLPKWQAGEESLAEAFAGAVLGPVITPIFGTAIMTGGIPFWGPKVLIGDDYEFSGYFPTAPYDEPQYPGYLMIDPEVTEEH
jgi:hypothetical protein